MSDEQTLQQLPPPLLQQPGEDFDLSTTVATKTVEPIADVDVDPDHTLVDTSALDTTKNDVDVVTETLTASQELSTEKISVYDNHGALTPTTTSAVAAGDLTIPNVDEIIMGATTIKNHRPNSNHSTTFNLELQQSCALLLHKRGGINFIPDDKFQAAGWDDITVNHEKCESTHLFGLELQAIKVQRLKQLMGVLQIKGRKKSQNSKFDMFRCLYDNWVKNKSPGGVGVHASIVATNALVGEQASQGEGGNIVGEDNNGNVATTTCTTAGATGTSSEASTKSTQGGITGGTFPKLPQIEQMSIPPKPSSGDVVPEFNSSLATLAIGLNSTNFSSQEKTNLIRKANERCDMEAERAEKRLKMDEEKLAIERRKENREEAQYQKNMIEEYTVKIDELRKKKKSNEGFHDLEVEEEILKMIKYYVKERAKLMEDKGNQVALV